MGKGLAGAASGAFTLYSPSVCGGPRGSSPRPARQLPSSSCSRWVVREKDVKLGPPSLENPGCQMCRERAGSWDQEGWSRGVKSLHFKIRRPGS